MNKLVIMQIQTTSDLVLDTYRKIRIQASEYKKNVNRPLTLTEKILAGHIQNMTNSEYSGGVDYIFLKPDRVALQDVTGQMVMLQFMQTGMKQVAVPTTTHCDHLIRAQIGSDEDTKLSLNENNEVFKFLESACAKYGVGFWKPGAGIIHQVVLENYAFPGGLMIGTDSHTPNAGGLGMLAIGVGGVDAAEVMAGLSWELLYPRKIGVHLKGKLNGWTAPKDIILKVAGELTVSGGTNAIIEYFGEGAESISCTGKATITNMGAEIGATCSIFPYDSRMEIYLRSTNRGQIADIANKNKDILSADVEVLGDPHKYFDKVLEIDLSKLEPHIVGPHTPDLARPISQMASDVIKNGYIDKISSTLIGSCTNSSYEDMSRVVSVVQQAKDNNLKIKTPLLVTPGSEQIRATIQRDGHIDLLEDIGATVLANACGPCIGQWSRPNMENKPNTILTSFNRNFPGRNDGSSDTMNFIASPEIIVAFALSGSMSFNPLKDTITTPDGKQIRLDEPKEAPEVPEKGFVYGKETYVKPSDNYESVEIIINKNSSRLQVLEPFEKWDGKDFQDLKLMVKVQGKCTTDHISPAGAWLSFRGHLDKLSDNVLLGVVNAFNRDTGCGKNALSGKIQPITEISRIYKKEGQGWIIIGDKNYGEGSSREHAAMTPRYLGCKVVVAKSFARIHETNLKKQGILALTFEDPKDYDKILEDDTISIIKLTEFMPKKSITCIINHADDTTDEIKLNHSYNESHIDWFKAGSALNILKENN